MEYLPSPLGVKTEELNPQNAPLIEKPLELQKTKIKKSNKSSILFIVIFTSIIFLLGGLFAYVYPKKEILFTEFFIKRLISNISNSIDASKKDSASGLSDQAVYEEQINQAYDRLIKNTTDLNGKSFETNLKTNITFDNFDISSVSKITYQYPEGYSENIKKFENISDFLDYISKASNEELSGVLPKVLLNLNLIEKTNGNSNSYDLEVIIDSGVVFLKINNWDSTNIDSAVSQILDADKVGKYQKFDLKEFRTNFLNSDNIFLSYLLYSLPTSNPDSINFSFDSFIKLVDGAIEQAYYDEESVTIFKNLLNSINGASMFKNIKSSKPFIDIDGISCSTGDINFESYLKQLESSFIPKLPEEEEQTSAKSDINSARNTLTDKKVKATLKLCSENLQKFSGIGLNLNFDNFLLDVEALFSEPNTKIQAPTEFVDSTSLLNEYVSSYNNLISEYRSDLSNSPIDGITTNVNNSNSLNTSSSPEYSYTYDWDQYLADGIIIYKKYFRGEISRSQYYQEIKALKKSFIKFDEDEESYINEANMFENTGLSDLFLTGQVTFEVYTEKSNLITTPYN